MPNQTAHYIFARRMWESLDAGMQRRIDPDSPAFRVGSFGPDPLFLDPRPRCRGEGIFLHRQPGSVALDRLRFSVRVKLPCAADYAAGFFAHYALDRLCHPELRAMQDRGEANHLAIESAYERELHRRGEADAPRRLQANWNLCRAAVEAYYTLSVRAFRRDLRMYWAMRHLMLLPAGNTICNVPGKIHPGWHGILPYPQPDEGVRRGMDFLDQQMQDCPEIAAEQLTRYFCAIDNELPLDPWTRADFAGRMPSGADAR